MGQPKGCPVALANFPALSLTMCRTRRISALHFIADISPGARRHSSWERFHGIIHTTIMPRRVVGELLDVGRAASAVQSSEARLVLIVISAVRWPHRACGPRTAEGGCPHIGV